MAELGDDALMTEAGSGVADDEVRAVNAVGQARPAARRRFGLRFKLTLLLAILTAGLAVIELGYRAHIRKLYAREVSEYKVGLYVPQEGDLAYTMYPGLEGTPKTRDAPDAPTWHFRVNSAGFRDVEPSSRPASVRRVMCLGDSYTFGWAVDDVPGPYPQRLQALLAGSTPNGADVQVFNLGVPGYNTELNYACLARNFDAIGPAVVVLAYVLNDAEPQANVPVRPEEKYRFCASWALEGMRRLLFERGWIGTETLKTRLNSYTNEYLKTFASDNPKWRVSRDALVRIDRFCRTHGARLMVCILPDVTQPLDGSYPYRSIHETVKGWTSNLGCPTVDMLPSFAGMDYHDCQVEGDGHPNERAHQVFAEALVPVVRSLLN